MTTPVGGSRGHRGYVGHIFMGSSTDQSFGVGVALKGLQTTFNS